MLTFKDRAKSKILPPFRTPREVSSLTIIAYLNARDMASRPKPAKLYKQA